MRFINYGRNGGSRLLYLLFVVVSCQTFVACQTKPLDIATALKPCQELLDKDELSAANECYRMAMLKYPQNAVEISKNGEGVFFKKCVELEEEKKDYEQAIVCFEGMTVLSPDKASVYIHLASSYYEDSKTVKDKTDDLARAEEAIKKAIEIRPTAIAHETYARILEEKSDYQNSLKEYREAIRIEPDDTLYLIRLALAQEKTNDFGGAIESYQRALTINPKDTNALYFLGLLYEKTGAIDKAIETIERRIAIEPAKQETLNKLKLLKQRFEVEKSNEKPLKSKIKTQSH